MSQLDEEAFLAGANMPSVAQVERAARLLAISRGHAIGEWHNFVDDARDILAICMNQTKIMIGR